MTWDRVLFHCFNPNEPHYEEPVATFQAGLILLDESEAEIIRGRMKEEAERHLYRGSTEQQVICLECREVGDIVTLLKHISTM